MYKRVSEFHNAFDITNSKELGFPAQDIRDLRIKLLLEEANEFIKAANEDDLVEQADGLIDTIYIAYGTALAYGFEPAIPFSEDSARRYPTPHLVTMGASYMNGLLTRYQDAEKANDLHLVIDMIERIIQLCLDICAIKNIPAEDVFAEVHASNMSKLGEDMKPIYREDGKVLKGPNYFRPNIARLVLPS